MYSDKLLFISYFVCELAQNQSLACCCCCCCCCSFSMFHLFGCFKQFLYSPVLYCSFEQLPIPIQAHFRKPLFYLPLYFYCIHSISVTQNVFIALRSLQPLPFSFYSSWYTNNYSSAISFQFLFVLCFVVSFGQFLLFYGSAAAYVI